MTDEQVIQLILIELTQARRKHPSWPENDKLLGAAIIAEESGEAIRAAVQLVAESGNEAALFREVIQTAAVCVRFLAGR